MKYPVVGSSVALSPSAVQQPISSRLLTEAAGYMNAIVAFHVSCVASSVCVAVLMRIVRTKHWARPVCGAECHMKPYSVAVAHAPVMRESARPAQLTLLGASAT